MRSFYFILAVVAVVAIHACDYEPAEQYFVDKPIPERPEISIDLSVPEGDTLSIFQDSTFPLNDLVGIENLYKVQIYLDNKIYIDGIAEPSFKIIVAPFKTGYYDLDVVVNMYSGSGSIADQQGLETYTVTKSWVVYIDREPLVKSTFTSIAPADGTLVLTWEKVVDDRFDHYRIRKYCNNTTLCDSFKIFNPNETSVNDPDFVGGEATYRLDVVTAGNVASEYDERLYKSEWTLEVKFEWTDNQTAVGKWRKSPFYNNVKETVINSSEHRTDPNDTTITRIDADLKFGQQRSILFNVVSTNEKSNINYTNYLFRGDRSHPRFYGSIHNKFDGLYYTLANSQSGSDTLYVFGEDKRVPLKAESLGTDAAHISTFSTDGKILYIMYNYPYQVLEWDVQTQSIKQNHSWTTTSLGINFTVTDDGKVLTGDKVLDLATGATLFTGWKEIPTIAPDGSQIFIQGYRYVWNGTTFANQSPRPFTADPDYLKQYPSDTLIYMDESEKKFKIYNAAGSSVLLDKTLTGTSFSYMFYDPVSHHFSFSRSSTFYWDNIKTGTSGSVPYYSYVSTANGYLICNQGFYIKLE